MDIFIHTNICDKINHIRTDTFNLQITGNLIKLLELRINEKDYIRIYFKGEIDISNLVKEFKKVIEQCNAGVEEKESS